MKSIFSRAASSLWHYKRRNILIFIWFFLLLFLLILVTIISIASQRQVAYLNKTVGNSVIIEKVEENSGEQDTFSSRDVGIFSEHPSVEAYNAVGMNTGVLSNALPVVRDRKLYEEYKKRVEDGGEKLDNCTLFGMTNSDIYTLFTSAAFTMGEGRSITAGDAKQKVAVISSLLAKENGLHIGDSISVNIANVFTNTVHLDPLRLTIIGLFNYPETSSLYKDTIVPLFAEEQPANFIFIPEGTLSAYSSIYAPLQFIAYLKDADQIESYINDMKQKVGNSYFNQTQGVTFTYKYIWDQKWFSAVSKPAQEISNMATATAVGLGIGIFVIILLIYALILNGKKYEMGIYLTLGESKTRLVIQTIIEEMALFLAALILASIIGVISAPSVSRIVMDRPADETNASIEQQREDIIRHQNYGTYSIGYDIRSAGTTFYFVNNALNVSDSIGTFMIFISAGTVVIIAALAGQVLYFLRKSPAKLLITK